MKGIKYINLLYALIVSQFFVALTPYFYDLVLVLVLVFFIFKSTNFKLYKFLFFPFLLFLFFGLIHEIRYFGNERAIFPKSLFSDLRPFLILLLVFKLVKNRKFRFNDILNLLFLNSLINFLFNFIGLLNSDYYRKLVSLIFNSNYVIIQHSENNGFPTSLSYVASLQGRFCGAYIQPISGGLSSSFIILVLIYLLRDHRINFKVLFIFILSIVNGYLTYSTMFQLLPIFILLWPVFKNSNRYTFLFLLGLIFIFSFLAFVFIDFNELSMIFFTLTSGRYSTDGNIAAVIMDRNFGLLDIFFGFDPYSFGHEGKGVGDSGYFIKWVSGGVVYIFLYFIILYNSLKYYMVKLTGLKNSNIFKFFDFLFIIFLIVELGTTPFSLPQFSFFFYTIILLLVNLEKPSFNVSF